MKPGRNDPCSCGSGKKFKNCCQGKAAVATSGVSHPTSGSASQPDAFFIRQLDTLLVSGRYADSENCARTLLKSYPDSGMIWKLFALALQMQGKDALSAMQKAVELLPGDAEAHVNLAALLRSHGRLESAAMHNRHALQLSPDFAEAHNNLGVVLQDLSQLDEAVASYCRALQIKPDFAEAHNNLGSALKDQGKFDDAVKSYRRAIEFKPDFAEAASNLLFALNYAANFTPAHYLDEAHKYGRIAAKLARERFTDWQCPRDPQRLRVGIVSGDLRVHPVGYFLESVLAHLDHSRIELLAYSSNPKDDELTDRIRRHFAAWVPLSGRNNEAAARLIHADRVHVLIDLSGHTSHNRLPVFAWKSAPVQVSWLGYFATTGVTEMDYLLADEVGVPERLRGQFTESIWYLPDTRLCFTAPKNEISVKPLPALSNDAITFGCFQNLPKLSDEVLAVWGRIFLALPDARLRIQCKQLDEPTQRVLLTQRLLRHGIAPECVAMHGATRRDEYLAAHTEVDLILDTFPYPGGTTTSEALWMGVPTLTLAGNSLLARQGASLMTAVGLGEWVAKNKDEYAAKAISFAGNTVELAALRNRLRSQVLASPLFDATRFARNLEDALWGMWLAHNKQAAQT